MASIHNAAGVVQSVELKVEDYREAANRGMSLQGFVNAKYPTNPEVYGTSFDQLCASERIFVSANTQHGIRPTSMAEMLDGGDYTTDLNGEAIVKGSTPTSRILAPSVILQAVEDRMAQDYLVNVQALNGLIAVDEGINGERYEQAIFNFSRAGKARSQGIAQLANPPTMLTITTSDRPQKIPTFSIGLEASDQALRATSIDLVALSIARQAQIESNERAQDSILAILNGDIDTGDKPLATLGKYTAASSLDPAATNGILTQRAWMTWNMRNAKLRTINYLITDVDTALAIEARAGRPTVLSDDSGQKRINTAIEIVNPNWPTSLKLWLTDDPRWPAGTILGIDTRYGLRRVRNLSADYQAIEEYVIRRAKSMRFDHGEHITRLYEDAFDVLTLN